MLEHLESKEGLRLGVISYVDEAERHDERDTMSMRMKYENGQLLSCFPSHRSIP